MEKFGVHYEDVGIELDIRYAPSIDNARLSVELNRSSIDSYLSLDSPDHAIVAEVAKQTLRLASRQSAI